MVGSEIMFGKRPRPETTDPSQAVLRCSFCSKHQNDVRKLIAGPTVFICDECIQVCVDIIEQDGKLDGSTDTDARAVTAVAASSYSSATTLPCTLCGMLTPAGDLLPIPERGSLCPGCLGEVEAALAESRGSDS